MKRRDFLAILASASSYGVCRTGWASSPCPPPTLGVENSPSVNTPCSAIDMESDWSLRSTTTGVFYNNNFTYRNTAKTLPITNTAELISSRAGPAGGTDSYIQLDTANKLSGGGSLRLNMRAANRGAYSNWATSFAGIATSAKTTIKNEFYLQFAYYADSVYRDFYFGGRESWGGKIAIIQAWNNSFSPGEVVIRREPRTPGGFISGYRYGRTSGVLPMYAFASGYADYVYSNFINRGTPAVTSIDTLQQRHGITNYASAGNGDANDPDQQHVPKLQSNGWTTIEVYVKQVSSGTGSIIKVWIAPYGQPPQLVFGSMAANLPLIGELDGATVPVQLYTGVQLTNYPNTAVNWPTQDTFVAYDELIVSDRPIAFPGGHDLPFPGSERPAGHPYAGLVDE